VRPLAVTFMAPIWMLTAWCELRCAFRNFRLDRLTALDVTTEVFDEEPGRIWADFMAQVT